jgi:hypothetical protein
MSKAKTDATVEFLRNFCFDLSPLSDAIMYYANIFTINTACYVWGYMKYSMILRCVRYGDFDKDYMLLPGVRYGYFVKNRMAILSHVIRRLDHTQRY